ncbi:bifunctional [glutamine synthetase] adenylyltransferase/[glutamine synthetase]-adenylyl-L-tyrosine phosphorylase [Nocardioides bruguierae]|uniref:Bifunctional glutamine synthetase adenylyltransferase/adenylyl-removing enzyme n=1 Tax=Nocardioides bruguierae TaxID=2945102 RepID=A0A9X2ID80_9ACTN|nr:bifunctional [glutamine synthetase] adenylyltransferase/[glutamine synthetase]-adenylyl-L-tyrosine phosphorylase [Nocardioides bruguierae]MCL8026400.1 bifunctional [glutamine synthetase] adenylyltransferase/[glutamine synthetase]-adenylyl-L-tyrosine phosphorylase [Nocardioides bruguierae]MCM0619461.1 bifunctional [glutamine synthetase] adenylyltransferase/[glutamine synthetase]-adenylyl-L-tyrosine phosphorylase [Nocardioides bruguierae]
MSRPLSSRTALLGHGFTDVDVAEANLALLGEGADPLLWILAGTADPDLALAGLVRLLEAIDEDPAGPGRARLLATLVDEDGTAMRLLSVLGTSLALTDHLVRHPEQWEDLRHPLLGSTRPPAFWLRACLLGAVGADPSDPAPVATLPDAQAMLAMRVEYRRHLLLLTSRDLAHGVGVDDVAAELSDLAAATLEAGLAVARQRVGAAAADVRLAVIAMGKCGARELNYVSDVDVVFVHEPVVPEDPDTPAPDPERVRRTATQLASHLIRVCSDPTREGEIWEVDAALRPEGKAGPLTRTLDGFLGYYERWASTWEFQALLKRRPVAGDLALGREWSEMLDPLVWTAAERDGFVEQTQAMRRRVVEHLSGKDADRQLKLGEGGLRDVEFAVQMLQLVHGRADETIRCTATLSALHHLTEGGYLGREDGEDLSRAYEFLRRLEHRIQLFRLRRTHVVPDDEASLRRLGRSLGLMKEPAAALEAEWGRVRREVSRLHQKVFYRPLLTAVAAIPGPDARLTPAAAATRLAALGYREPTAALRHLEALTAGVGRAAAIQRTLLPAMLQWFADCGDPDGGLFGFRRISESLGQTPWYLALLRDEGQVAERLARVLATSKYATSLLEHEPQGLRVLADTDLGPRPLEPMLEEMRAAAARREEPEAAVRALRAVRRRELFRLAAADSLGLVDVEQVGAALSRLTDATLETALTVVERAVLAARGLETAPTRFAVIAMGRYGGFELSYGSDADVLFVHEPVEGADHQEAAAYAQALAHELRRLLGLPGGDPPLVIDADLRPEGRSGPLVRTLESYAAYYERWSMVWEAQALLRADAVVGDPDLRAAFTALVDPLRFPEAGLTEDDVLEVRRIKGRVDKERLPRGADPATHLKLGRGGLADVEWTVQLIQMRHGHEVEGLRRCRTLPALAAAAEAGLVDGHDAEVLADTWRWVSRVRNAVTLVRGKPSDQLPKDAHDRHAVAALLGYEDGSSEELIEDHLRRTRTARQVVDRVFWED